MHRTPLFKLKPQRGVVNRRRLHDGHAGDGIQTAQRIQLPSEAADDEPDAGADTAADEEYEEAITTGKVRCEM